MTVGGNVSISKIVLIRDRKYNHTSKVALHAVPTARIHRCVVPRSFCHPRFGNLNVNSGLFSKSMFPYILHCEVLGFVNWAVALTPHTPTGNSRRHPYCSIRPIVRSTRIVQPLRQLIACFAAQNMTFNVHNFEIVRMPCEMQRFTSTQINLSRNWLKH